MDQQVQAAAAARREREEEERALKKMQKVDAQRVSRFGARLDAGIASDDLSTVLSKEGKEEHEQLFTEGVQLMRRGEYRLSVKAFTQATAAAPGGLTGRIGGQYAIYLAEALQADGRRKEAVGLLQKCEAHPDKDVRKIADSVLYIMRAPELKLDGDQFVSLDMSGIQADWGGAKRATAQKDPPPEKYSVEWYMEEAAKRKGRKSPDASHRGGKISGHEREAKVRSAALNDFAHR